MKRKALEFFGEENILVYHSRLTDREKAEAWWRVKNNEAKIILSSRIGIFLPFSNLQFVAIEEEHDDSYKSDQSPRFHARDIAEQLNVRTVFSRATPSFESFYKAKKEKIAIAQISTKKQKNNINIVDIKEELLCKNTSPISRLLEEKINSTLKKKKKILLFLNRRGFYSFIFCTECGQSMKCKYCNVSLTHHKKSGKDFLLCHHCGRVFNAFTRCSNCASTKLKFFGFGTQKIE